MAKAAVKELTLAEQVVDLRDNQEKGWAEISHELGIGQGRAAFLYMCETVPEKDRIKARNDDEMAAKIVAARDTDQLSWGQIAARSGWPESKVKRVYEATSGVPTLGLRIGKGGRYPGEGQANGTAPAKTAGATKKTAAQRKAEQAAAAEGGTRKRASKAAAPAKKAASTRGVPADENPHKGEHPLASASLKQIKDRLDHKTITVNDHANGGTQRIAVKVVRSAKNGELTLTDDDGNVHTVLVTQIVRATK